MSKATDVLLSIFNLKKEELKPHVMRNGGNNEAENYGFNFPSRSDNLVDITTLETERHRKIQEYESMDTDSFIAEALNIFADEAVQINPDGKSIWAESDNIEVKEAIGEFFETVGMEGLLFGMARNLAKYGDMFVLYSCEAGEGINRIYFAHPSSLSAKIDKETWSVTGYESSIYTVADSGTLDDEGMHQFTYGIETKLQGDGLSLTDLSHFRTVSSNLTSPYGTSFLEGCREDWKKYTMLETSIIIYRIHSTGTKIIYNIDTGDASPDRARSIAESWRAALTKRRFADFSDTMGNGPIGSFFQAYEPFSMHKQVFWPKRRDSSSGIDYISVPADITSLEDLNKLESKVKLGLGLPLGYFSQDGQGGWEANKPLAQQDVAFARRTMRLKKALAEGITTLCKFHLAARGIADAQFKIRMNQPIELLKMQELEIASNIASLASEMMGLADTMGLDSRRWAKYILRRFVGLSPKELKFYMLSKEEHDEHESDQDALAMGPGTPGAFGGGGEEGGGFGGEEDGGQGFYDDEMPEEDEEDEEVNDRDGLKPPGYTAKVVRREVIKD